MPTFNCGTYISESIRSVQAQTYSYWELVVVDDGSTDDTAEIVREFLLADNRVRYIFQQNGGQGNARNSGIKYSKGEILAFLDADDIWLPNKLELQIAALNQSQADLVFSNGFIFEGSTSKDQNTTFPIVDGRRQGDEMLKRLLLNNCIPMLSVLLRRETIESVGLFSEKRQYQNCEDYELWLRLAKSGAVFFGMKEKLVRYRRHASAATYCNSKALKPMIAVVKAHVYSVVLGEVQARNRIRGLYRDLITALVEEGNLNEARQYMHEFATWDGHKILTRLQTLLIRFLPRQFNFISRECLYRVEWHIQKRLNRYGG